ncbi:MAG: hypothetical protein Tsb0021_06010 [Chlamydiales bacterium]
MNYLQQSSDGKIVLRFVISTLFFFIYCCSFSVHASSLESLNPPSWELLTLNYSKDEVSNLREVPKPDSLITSEQLSRLTKELDYFTDSTPIPDIYLTLMPAYIANAQKDFALLSYFLTGKLTGNLGPVTLWTLQLFVPKALLPSVREDNFDVFSCLLSALVVSKYASRLEKEIKQIKDYPIRKGEGLWSPTSPGYTGLNYGSVKTWYLTSSKEFMTDPPPKNRNFWEEQVKQVKEEQQNLNGSKVQKVFEWGKLTALHAGDFEHLLYTFLKKKNLSVLDELYVRALYLSAIADSNAAAFHSKYIFCVMRPSQRDDGIKPLIIIPNHPSYPSAHSTISATANIIMSELFPEDSEEWNQMAEEAGMSRIWGGIHYPIDHQAGKKLGNEVGEAILKRISKKNQ